MCSVRLSYWIKITYLLTCWHLSLSLYICANPFIYATKFEPVRRILAGFIHCKKVAEPAGASVETYEMGQYQPMDQSNSKGLNLTEQLTQSRRVETGRAGSAAAPSIFGAGEHCSLGSLSMWQTVGDDQGRICRGVGGLNPRENFWPPPAAIKKRKGGSTFYVPMH